MKLLEVIDISHKPKQKKKLIESTSLTRPDGIVQVADNRFLLVINDFDGTGEQRIYSYDSQDNANRALDQYTDPDTTPRQFDQENRASRRDSTWRRAQDNVSEADFQRKVQRSSWLQRFANGRIFTAFTSLLRFSGVALTVYYGILSDAADVMEDETLSPEEKEERVNILYGLLVVEVTAMLLIIFRTSRILNRAITSLRTTVRTMQAAAGFSVVGTVPAIISFIASEAAFWAIGYALAHSGVQRALADFLAGTFVGNIFEFAGQGVNAAAAALAEATNDRFGSRDLQRWMGFPQTDQDEMIRSAAYGSSEWAKLVMGAIMYPPQADPLLVPYIPAARREAMLAEKLNVSLAELEQIDAQALEDGQSPEEQPSDTQAPQLSPATNTGTDNADGPGGSAAMAAQTIGPGMANQEIPEPAATGTPDPNDPTGFSGMTQADILRRAQSGQGFGG